MSKEFLTVRQAGMKLSSPITTGNDYITKRACIAAKADPWRLSSYADNEYPPDDDIVPGVFSQEFRFEVQSVGVSARNDTIKAGSFTIEYTKA